MAARAVMELSDGTLCRGWTVFASLVVLLALPVRTCRTWLCAANADTEGMLMKTFDPHFEILPSSQHDRHIIIRTSRT